MQDKIQIMHMIIDFTDKLQSLKLIYSANFWEKTFSPWHYLNAVKNLNLENLFPNLNVNIRIFPQFFLQYLVSIQRFFLVLKRVKNCLSATMCQELRQTIKFRNASDETRVSQYTTNLDGVINEFAMEKAKKGNTLTKSNLFLIFAE